MAYARKFRDEIIAYRKNGNSYSQLARKYGVSKSTLSQWLQNIKLDEKASRRISEHTKKILPVARQIARHKILQRREEYFKNLVSKNKHLGDLLLDKQIAKLVLVILYLGEGSKSLKRGGLVFGNSDPGVISLFLLLFRKTYNLDESKFRCTIQCRADQKTKDLQKFWSIVTRIPERQFYKARIDKRSINKTTKNTEYKGVLRIDYFSAAILHDILMSIKIIIGKGR